LKVSGRFGAGLLSDVPSEVERAERLGYDAITTSETKYEATTRWTLAAHVSTRAEIGTSIIIAFPRSPFVMAQMAWELQKLTGGRVMIGLGTQVKGHNERRFSSGMWEAPATRMEEYIRMMRAVWDTFQTGAKPEFEGRFYNFTLCPPAFNMGPIDVPPPKVFISAVGPAMTRVAGRVADGLFLHSFTTEKYVREVTLPELARGAEQAGRNLSDIEVSGGGMMALGKDDSEIEQKLLELRQPISFYGSRTYLNVFDTHGLGELGLMLHDMSVKGEWERMVESVPLDVVREFAVTSTYENLPDVLTKRMDYATRVSFDAPSDTPEDEARLIDLISRVQAI
jgi:probable F420-dependent oxidoreductase